MAHIHIICPSARNRNPPSFIDEDGSYCCTMINYGVYEMITNNSGCQCDLGVKCQGHKTRLYGS